MKKFFFSVVAAVIVFLVFFFAVVKPQFFAAVQGPTVVGGEVVAMAKLNDQGINLVHVGDDKVSLGQQTINHQAVDLGIIGGSVESHVRDLTTVPATNPDVVLL